MMETEWLSVVMQGSFSEIYIIDCSTLHFFHVNRSACANLQYSEDELIGKPLIEIAKSLTMESLEQALRLLRTGLTAQIALEAIHTRKDGSAYPIEFRFLQCQRSSHPVFIAIGNDISSQRASAEALFDSESRFRAIAASSPGLVYQFLRRADGSIAFPYLSEGCHALLGVTVEQLRADSSLFLALILPEDRPSYKDSMAASIDSMKSWNWEGRVWIEAWKDIKWINLRSTPRILADGSLQWDGIMTNITQSKLEEAEIKRSRTQLAELSAHIETVKEQERTRIAREIHDDLGGNLTAIKMALALLTRRLPASEPELAEKAGYVNALVDRTIEATHRIAGDLRPGMLDFGLAAAIEWQIKEFEKQTGIPCLFSSNKKDIELDLDKATALFRIFQETLTNVAKHAQADSVIVRLVRTNRNLHLEITDNGRGITPVDRLKPKSFGIRGMMERASALGGRFSIAPLPEGGTAVAIKLPLPTA